VAQAVKEGGEAAMTPIEIALGIIAAVITIGTVGVHIGARLNRKKKLNGCKFCPDHPAVLSSTILSKYLLMEITTEEQQQRAHSKMQTFEGGLTGHGQKDS
jgi:hypothetical protein